MSKSLFKKVTCIAIAAAFIITLASCGKDKTTTENGNTTATGTTSAATEKVDYSKMPPLKLSAMLIAWGTVAEKDNPIEKEFEKRTNSDLDVTFVPYAEYPNRFNLLLASGDVKDISQAMKVSGDIFYPQLVQAIKGGVFTDLDSVLKNTDYLKQNAIMKNWSEDVWKYASFNKKIYALPRTVNVQAQTSGLIVRKDLMEKAGLKEPTTVDEAADFIIKMTKAGEYYGLQFATDDVDATADVKAIAVAYTGVQDWGVDKNGDFFFQAFMPEYKGFLNWMKKLYDAKAIDPEFSLKNSANSNFTTGKSATKMNSWWNCDQSEDRVKKMYFDKALMAKTPDATPWITLPLKGPKGYAVSRTTGWDTPVFISSKVKKDLPRIMDILNHTDEDFQTFLINGIEGMHYTKNADGTFARNDEQNKNRTRDYAGGWNMMFLRKDPDNIKEKFVDYSAPKALIDRVTAVGQAADKYMKEMNLGLPQLTLDAPTYQKQWATVIKDLNNNRTKYIMGKMTEADWDKYVKDVTGTDTYKQILKEFKDAYAANK